MRIVAPTYTQTPNDLFDHWLPLLGDVELKVLLVIMRKTFGFHKPRDFISISQLEKLTGSNQTNVVKAAKSLEGKGLIIRSVEGSIGKQVTYYELVVHDDSNNCYPYQGERGDFGTPLPRREGTPPNLGGTKETITKERTLIDSDSLPPDAATRVENKIKIDIINKKPIFVGIEDLMTMFIQHRQETTKEEIDELFKKLEDYKDPIRDFYTFCDTIIKNMRKSKICKEIKEKETKCPQTTQNQKNNTTKSNKNLSIEKSKTTNDVTSTRGTLEQLYPNWRDLFGLPKRYPTT